MSHCISNLSLPSYLGLDYWADRNVLVKLLNKIAWAYLLTPAHMMATFNAYGYFQG
jgi:hypothetical protein